MYLNQFGDYYEDDFIESDCTVCGRLRSECIAEDGEILIKAREK